jgi:membrane dipeptidase
MTQRRFLPALALLTLAACAPAPAPTASDAPPALLTLDTHLDTPTHFDRAGWSIMDRHTFASDLSHVDVPRMIEGGLSGGFFVIYTPQGDDAAAMLAHAQRRLAAVRRVVAEHPQAMEIALTAADVERIAATGKRAILISIENSAPLGDDLSRLQAFYDGGVRMAGPVHSRTNQFADSATGERRWGGLSALGRQWVAEMNRLGMVIDGSHSSDEALEQMMALSTTPVILSHSGFKVIFEHRRNVPDALARSVAAQGGTIQINSVFLSRFNNSAARGPLYDLLDSIDTLSPAAQRDLATRWAALDQSERVNEGDIDLYVRAIMHCVALVGTDHCGLGADWDGGGGVAGMDDVAALPAVRARLTAAGITPEQMRALMSGNVLRVMRIVESARAAR